MFKTKKLGRFPYIIMIISVIFAMTIIIIFSLLWSALERFESNTPESYMRDMLGYVQNGEISSFMSKVEISPSEFFTPEDYKKYLEEKIGENIEDALIEEQNSQSEIVNGENIKSHTFLVYQDGKDGILFTLTAGGMTENGNALYSCKQEDIAFNSMIVRAPSQATVIADGVELTQEYVIDKKVIAGFDKVADRTDLPHTTTYRLERFIDAPNISVSGEHSSGYLVADNCKGSESADINIIFDVDKQLRDSIKRFSIDVSKAYAMFVSRDLERADFLRRVARDSDFYKSVTNFDNRWFSVHSSYEFQNLTADNVMAYSEKYFSCDVSFNYVVKQNRTEKTYEMNYRLMLEKINLTSDSDDDYKIINLINI